MDGDLINRESTFIQQKQTAHLTGPVEMKRVAKCETNKPSVESHAASKDGPKAAPPNLRQQQLEQLLQKQEEQRQKLGTEKEKLNHLLLQLQQQKDTNSSWRERPANTKINKNETNTFWNNMTQNMMRNAQNLQEKQLLKSLIKNSGEAHSELDAQDDEINNNQNNTDLKKTNDKMKQYICDEISETTFCSSTDFSTSPVPQEQFYRDVEQKLRQYLETGRPISCLQTTSRTSAAPPLSAPPPSTIEFKLPPPTLPQVPPDLSTTHMPLPLPYVCPAPMYPQPQILPAIPGPMWDHQGQTPTLVPPATNVVSDVSSNNGQLPTPGGLPIPNVPTVVPPGTNLALVTCDPSQSSNLSSNSVVAECSTRQQNSTRQQDNLVQNVPGSIRPRKTFFRSPTHYIKSTTQLGNMQQILQIGTLAFPKSVHNGLEPSDIKLEQETPNIGAYSCAAEAMTTMTSRRDLLVPPSQLPKCLGDFGIYRNSNNPSETSYNFVHDHDNVKISQMKRNFKEDSNPVSTARFSTVIKREISTDSSSLTSSSSTSPKSSTTCEQEYSSRKRHSPSPDSRSDDRKQNKSSRQSPPRKQHRQFSLILSEQSPNHTLLPGDSRHKYPSVDMIPCSEDKTSQPAIISHEEFQRVPLQHDVWNQSSKQSSYQRNEQVSTSLTNDKFSPSTVEKMMANIMRNKGINNVSSLSSDDIGRLLLAANVGESTLTAMKNENLLDTMIFARVTNDDLQELGIRIGDRKVIQFVCSLFKRK